MSQSFLRLIAFLLIVAATLFGAEQAGHLNKRALKELLASATTAADHHRLVEHYKTEAAKFNAKQTEHQNEAAEYYQNPGRYPVPKYPTKGQHCRDLAWYYGTKAAEATNLAAMHDALANGQPPANLKLD